MKALLGLWPQPDERRRIWIDVVKAGVLGLLGYLGLCLWGWWTNTPRFPLAVLSGSVPVPTWLVVFLVIGTGLCLVQLYRHYRKPDHVRRYLSDTLDHITWEWDYDDKHEITNLTPLCKRCQTGLTLTTASSNVVISGVHFSKTVIYCPTCNTSFEIMGTTRLKEDHALPKIRRRIRTGEWAKSSSTR